MAGAWLAAAAPAAAAQETVQVRFAEPSLQAVENRGAVRVVVERVDLPVSRLLVHYRTAEVASSATPPGDYVHTAGTLVFEVGVRSSAFTVFVRDDEVAEDTEHLLLHLETSSGSGASSRLTVLDDDLPPARDVPAASTVVTTPPSGTPTPPVVVASSANSTRRVVVVPARRRVPAAARVAPKRRIILEQTPTTPFELRPAPGSSGGEAATTVVDPVLALGAGLLLARVAAEAWFRARIAIGGT